MPSEEGVASQRRLAYGDDVALAASEYSKGKERLTLGSAMVGVETVTSERKGL